MKIFHSGSRTPDRMTNVLIRSERHNSGEWCRLHEELVLVDPLNNRLKRLCFVVELIDGSIDYYPVADQDYEFRYGTDKMTFRINGEVRS